MWVLIARDYGETSWDTTGLMCVLVFPALGNVGRRGHPKRSCHSLAEESRVILSCNESKHEVMASQINGRSYDQSFSFQTPEHSCSFNDTWSRTWSLSGLNFRGIGNEGFRIYAIFRRRTRPFVRLGSKNWKVMEEKANLQTAEWMVSMSYLGGLRSRSLLELRCWISPKKARTCSLVRVAR